MSQLKRNILASLAFSFVLLLILGHRSQWLSLEQAKVAASVWSPMGGKPTPTVPTLANTADGAPTANNTDEEGVRRHQLAAHLSRTSVSQRQCDAISARAMQDSVDNAGADSLIPFALHFHNGQALQQGEAYSVRDEFCSVIFVPQTPKPQEVRFEESPIEVSPRRRVCRNGRDTNAS